MAANLAPRFQETIDTLLTTYPVVDSAHPPIKSALHEHLSGLAQAFGTLDLRGQRVLDIACGSSESRMPPKLNEPVPFEKLHVTPEFQPWLCRLLHHLGADAVGVDIGNNDREVFTHYQLDLGVLGVLDFLPSDSFDAVHDDRLFGSPEFRRQFPERAGRLTVAAEIQRQEQRLLRTGGIVLHTGTTVVF